MPHHAACRARVHVCVRKIALRTMVSAREPSEGMREGDGQDTGKTGPTGSETKRWKGEGFIVAIKGNARKARQRSSPLRYAMPLRQVYDRRCTGVLFFTCIRSCGSPPSLFPSLSSLHLLSYRLKRYLLVGAVLTLVIEVLHASVSVESCQLNFILKAAIVVSINV